MSSLSVVSGQVTKVQDQPAARPAAVPRLPLEQLAPPGSSRSSVQRTIETHRAATKARTTTLSTQFKGLRGVIVGGQEQLARKGLEMEEQAGRASLTTAKAVYTATMCQAAQVQCAEARFLEIAGRLDTSNRANGELQKELETLRAENVAFLVIDAPEEPNFPEARPFLLTGESVDDHVSPKAAEKPRWSSSFNTGKLAASLAWGLYLTGISAVASTRQSRAGVSLGMAGATVLFYPKLFSANQMGPTLARAAGGAIITGIVFALGSRVNLAASRAPLLCGMLPALFAGQMMGRGIEYLF